MGSGIDVERHRCKRRGASDGAGWPLSNEPEDLSTGTSRAGLLRQLPAYTPEYTSESLRESESQLQVALRASASSSLCVAPSLSPFGIHLKPLKASEAFGEAFELGGMEAINPSTSAKALVGGLKSWLAI